MRTTELSRVSRAAEGRSIRRAAAASYLATINKGNSEKVVMVAWPRDEGALYPLFLGAYHRPHLRTTQPSNQRDLQQPRAGECRAQAVAAPKFFTGTSPGELRSRAQGGRSRIG
jgi:hypothetical protein